MSQLRPEEISVLFDGMSGLVDTTRAFVQSHSYPQTQQSGYDPYSRRNINPMYPQYPYQNSYGYHNPYGYQNPYGMTSYPNGYGYPSSGYMNPGYNYPTTYMNDVYKPGYMNAPCLYPYNPYGVYNMSPYSNNPYGYNPTYGMIPQRQPVTYPQQGGNYYGR